MRLATPADDADLRLLLRRSVLPGAVRIAFTREPSYAAGANLAGGDDVTVLFERDGHATAMGRCSSHAMHRNGDVCRIGYLGELRTDPALPTPVRALRDGYALLAEAASRDGTEGFFTSIADDNARARRVLGNGGRLGLPTYRPICGLVTFVAPVSMRAARARAGRPVASDAATGQQPDDGLRDELTAFLERHARQAQLTLSWDDARWHALAAHGITAGDFAVVRHGRAIVAAAAVWDQRAFRQTVIDSYTGMLRIARPAVNAVQALRGRPALPAAGRVLAQGALLAATVESARHWPALWREVQLRAAALGLDWLVLAVDQRDPSAALLRRLMRPREYATTLFDVSWRDRPEWQAPWDARLFRPEVGLL